jgi:inhibitor of cysteine peptidase
MRHIRLAAILGLIIVLAGCAAGTTILTADDDGAEIELADGEQVVVELESNPTTGYLWQVVASEGVRQEGVSKFLAGEADVVGAAGIDRFTFLRDGEDPGEISLEYRRVWETTAVPEATWSATVTGN